MPEFFRDWEEAARRSTFEKAVSDARTITYHGKPLAVEIIKPLSGDAWHVQAGSGFELFDRRPTTQEVDEVRRWKRY